MTWLTRTSPADLEIRADGDGRTVFGVVVPYNSPADIVEARGAYRETFARGAFNGQLADPAAIGRVRLLSQHQRDREPVWGARVELRDDAAGLIGAFKVAKTQAGDEALELVRDGALDAFRSGSDRSTTTGTVAVPKWSAAAAQIREASSVTFPAYADALVAGVRASTRSVSPADAAGAWRSSKDSDVRKPTPRARRPTRPAPHRSPQPHRSRAQGRHPHPLRDHRNRHRRHQAPPRRHRARRARHGRRDDDPRAR